MHKRTRQCGTGVEVIRTSDSQLLCFFSSQNHIGSDYDLERIIDDWILMGFLVGNDFIPHLPHLHINHDALPLLYKTYISVRPSLEGEKRTRLR